MDNLIAVSPLAEKREVADQPLVFQHSRLKCEEVKDYGLLRVQVFNRGTEPAEALVKHLPQPLPTAGTMLASDNRLSFWFAPGEWGCAVAAGQETAEAARLNQQLSEQPHFIAAVSTITDSRIVLRISGTSARDLLGVGSGVDFHPSAFKAGQCVTTRFAHIAVLIAQPDNHDSFLLVADRSHGKYLWEWLEDSATTL